MIEDFKHIIWDWNGTLLDDVKLSLSIINRILEEKDLKLLTLTEYRNIFTFPVRNYYEKAGLDLDVYPFEVLGAEWIAEYEKRKSECRLFKDAEEVLKRISNLSVNQSVLSAYSQNALVEIIAAFNLSSYFTMLSGLDHIYADGKISQGKNMVKKLKLNKNEILMIGDTVHDYEVADEIGAECILIAAGHQTKERLQSCGVPVLNDISELMEI